MSEHDVLAMMRSSGVRITPQRRAVATAFIAHGSLHLTAEEVWHRARTGAPEISRATVYNTLRELVRCGGLRAVSLDEGPTRFDPNMSDRHAHTVCRTCGAVEDVAPGAYDAPAATSAFVVEHVEVILRGLCPRCAVPTTATPPQG